MQDMGDGTDTLVGRTDVIPEGEGPIYVSETIRVYMTRISMTYALVSRHASTRRRHSHCNDASVCHLRLRCCCLPTQVCTRNDDLANVIERTPPARRQDLVFLQNGILGPFLEQHGL